MFLSKSLFLLYLGVFIGGYFLLISQGGSGAIKDPAVKSMNLTNGTTHKKYLSSNLASKNNLGNHLFELTALVGIARSLNRTPVFMIEDASYQKYLLDTNTTFPGLIKQYLIINGSKPKTIRDTVFQERCCIYENPKVLLNIEDEHIYLTGSLYQSYKYFDGMRNEVLSWLAKPTNKFEGLPKSDKSTHVTCAHTRRGDFIHVGFQASDDHFVREAVKYVQKEEKSKDRRKVVVILGDDREFMKKVYNDSVLSSDPLALKTKSNHFISTNTKSDDLLYSRSNCDVVLISASQSTFGWWIGYVSKGKKVFHMDMRVQYVGALKAGRLIIRDYYPPDWTPLIFAADNVTIIVGDK